MNQDNISWIVVTVLGAFLIGFILGKDTEKTQGKFFCDKGNVFYIGKVKYECVKVENNE